MKYNVDLVCPKCRSRNKFMLYLWGVYGEHVDVYLQKNGVQDIEYMELGESSHYMWTPSSKCTCDHCKYKGVIAEFQNTPFCLHEHDHDLMPAYEKLTYEKKNRVLALNIDEVANGLPADLKDKIQLQSHKHVFSNEIMREIDAQYGISEMVENSIFTNHQVVPPEQNYWIADWGNGDAPQEVVAFYCISFQELIDYVSSKCPKGYREYNEVNWVDDMLKWTKWSVVPEEVVDKSKLKKWVRPDKGENSETNS